MTEKQYEIFQLEVTRRSTQYVVSWQKNQKMCTINGHIGDDAYFMKHFGFTGEVTLEENYISITFSTNKYNNQQYYVEFDLDHVFLLERMIPKFKQLAACWQAIYKSEL